MFDAGTQLTSSGCGAAAAAAASAATDRGDFVVNKRYSLPDHTSSLTSSPARRKGALD